MIKWILRLGLAVVVGVFGYSAYLNLKGGYFELPEFNETPYAISFKNGMRAIVVDAEVARPMESNSAFFRRLADANPDRKYLGFPWEVPSWFEDTWSFCYPPTDEQRAEILATMPEDMKRSLIGARFEAICTIKADEEEILRGLIYSVPGQ